MKLFLIFICFSKLFGDLIYPPNNHEINHIHVMFEWEKETATVDTLPSSVADMLGWGIYSSKDFSSIPNDILDLIQE